MLARSSSSRKLLPKPTEAAPDNDSLKTELTELKEKYNKSVKVSENLRQENSELQQELTKLKSELESVKKENSEMSNQLSDYQKRINLLNEHFPKEQKQSLCSSPFESPARGSSLSTTVSATTPGEFQPIGSQPKELKNIHDYISIMVKLSEHMLSLESNIESENKEPANEVDLEKSMINDLRKIALHKQLKVLKKIEELSLHCLEEANIVYEQKEKLIQENKQLRDSLLENILHFEKHKQDQASRIIEEGDEEELISMQEQAEALHTERTELELKHIELEQKEELLLKKEEELDCKEKELERRQEILKKEEELSYKKRVKEANTVVQPLVRVEFKDAKYVAQVLNDAFSDMGQLISAHQTLVEKKILQKTNAMEDRLKKLEEIKGAFRGISEIWMNIKKMNKELKDECLTMEQDLRKQKDLTSHYKQICEESSKKDKDIENLKAHYEKLLYHLREQINILKSGQLDSPRT